jgi:hypothetical protein
MNADVLDSLDYTVRVVRTAEGRSFLVAIGCAHPWVLRKRVLIAEDVD